MIRQRKYEVGEEHEENIKKIIDMGTYYMQNNIPKKIPKYTLILEQIKYISPILWIIQISVLLFILLFNSIETMTVESLQRMLYCLSPLIALITVPEIMKDYFYDLSELESSCKNSNVVVFITRLIIVGFSNILFLTILTYIISGQMKENFFELISYSLLPFNLMNILVLLLVNMFKVKNHHTCLLCSLISIIVISVITPNILLMNLNYMIFTIFVFITFIILSIQVFLVLKTMSSKEGYKYGFVLK